MDSGTFLQKSSTRCPMSEALTALAAAGDSVWATTRSGLLRFGSDEWRAAHEIPSVKALAVGDEGRLWVATDEGLLRLEEEALFPYGPRMPVRALAVGEGMLACAAKDGILVLRAGRAAEVTRIPEFTVRGLCIAAQGDLWCATDRGLIHWDNGAWSCLAADDTPLLCDDVRAVAADPSGHLWVGTAAGVQITSAGRGWHTPQGIPCKDVRCLSLGADGSCWVGTSLDAARLKEGEWEYFAGRRWLPNDRVNAVLALPDGGAWVATDGGIARIEYTPMTLAEKAARFEERIAARHQRHGYVTSCRLAEPGNPESFVYEASDNDGLWTALYVAANAFRFAVTREPDAWRCARRSLDALIRLEAVTPIPGFPARAVVRKGEARVEKSHGEWHDSEDGEWEWKGDTSSDEIDGHFFAFSIYHDLVADDDEKAEIAAVVGRIADHLLSHDFNLVDVDGEHTRWGVWSPRLLNDDPAWRAEQGLNSLEILSHLKVAARITGQGRFEAAYRYLASTEHYALNAVMQKITRETGEVNHSDDELAFISYYPLLRYEKDPALRALYLLSLERTWRIERPERCPLWNLIYGALTGKACDVDESLRALRRIPMELIEWDVRNSHRADIALDPDPDRFDRPQSLEVLPPDERAVMKWNGNPFRLDGGNGGRGEDDGTFFLLPYWLGRYHGLIA